jgi:hypothetical protein
MTVKRKLSVLLVPALAGLALVATGCGGAGTSVDAGTPCTFGTCGGNDVCNPTTQVCETKGCNPSNSEPDACAYGQYCTAGGACYDVGAPACTNFGTSGYQLSWSQASSTGPVTYYASKLTADSSWCGQSPNVPADLTLSVLLYNWNGTFAASGSTFPANTFYYVDSAGTRTDAKTMFRPASGYSVSADGKELSLTINFCGVTSNPLSVGFYYTGGNGYCASF